MPRITIKQLQETNQRLEHQLAARDEVIILQKKLISEQDTELEKLRGAMTSLETIIKNMGPKKD